MTLCEVPKYYIQMHVSTYFYFIIPIIYLYIYKKGSIIFLMGLAPNVLGYRHPAAILDRSKNKCCGLITDGEELKNNQLCFSVDTTVLHLFSDLSRTCPHTSGGWVPPLALTPKNNRSVSFVVA